MSASVSLTVSGCTHRTIDKILNGTFLMSNQSNHGMPVYKKTEKVSGLDIMLYFWDERDGPSFSGWWFGPKVGGDQVWAYNGDKSANTPPLGSWKVPWDGPVDQSLRLQVGGGHGGCGGAPPAGSSSQSGRGPAPGQAPGGRGPGPDLQRQRQDEEDRRRREAADRQRQMAEQQRREEERRRRDAEAAKRRQKEEEERARKEVEMKKRREEEEVRRKEHAAALAVRKVIQRVRVATPETYDNLRAELEEAQAKHLEELGSQAQKVTQEAQETLQQAQKRIDEINEKRAEDERRRLEEERRAKEEAEKVERIMKEVTAEVKEAEEKVTEAQEAAKSITEGEDSTPEAMVEAASSTEKVVEASKAALDKHIQSLDDKWRDMGNGDAARRVRREMDDLHRQLQDGKRQLERLATTVSTTRDKATRKAAALKKERERRSSFEKHDSDQDGKLSRQEVLSFSKAEFEGFEPAEVVLDKIMRILEPITFEKFHAMHLKVAIAQSEVKARQKRAEEAERQRKLEEQRQEVQKIIDEAGEHLTAADNFTAEAEGKSRPLAKENNDMSASEIEATAVEAEELAKKTEGELEAATEKFKKAEDDCEANPDLRGFDKKDVPRLWKRHESIKARAEKVVAASKKARERAVRKAYAEMDQKRLQAATAIRTRMGAETKTGEQMFASINEDAPVTKEKFAEFAKGLADCELAEGEAEKLFEHIAGGAEDIGKERFMELIRLYYKCVKGTVLSEDISIKSKNVRRLDVGEVLEALEGPTKEEGVGVQRVRCQCVSDEAVGWVTIAGNQGTPFLEPGGNFFNVVKETLLTDGLSVQDSKTVRRLSKGEVIEVLEFQKKDASVDVKRIKGKAKLDGATGWITVASNQGTVFLEAA
mmetsp:Transcript_87148/g.255076  ORF Transcript_87148/g.255076 Transcript_87148/m.255076 type:complete len:878 (+) Transcript_87148:90-2723(+)